MTTACSVIATLSSASSVAPDEVLRAQRLTVGQPDVDPGVVLREAGHLASVRDAHRQLGDPGGQEPLDVVLPEPERVRMTRREVAHVQHGRAERRDLSRLTLGEESTSDPTLTRISLLQLRGPWLAAGDSAARAAAS